MSNEIKTDSSVSEELLTHHKDGRKPFRDNRTVYCPYSVDEKPADCEYKHRAPAHVEVVINGVKIRLLKCYDGRLHNLKDVDYIDIEPDKK